MYKILPFRTTLLLLLLVAQNVFAIDIDVTNYQSALVPSGHGAIVSTANPRTRLYPSRLQSMQFMVFFNPNSTSALYVQTEDSQANVAQWRLLQSGGTKTLRITFYNSPEPNVVVEPITINPQKPYVAAAERYKEWAFEQSWAKRKNSIFDSVKVFALGASPYFTVIQNEYLAPFISHFNEANTSMSNPATATWLTLWRSDAFDVAYPRYTPANVQGSFPNLLSWLHNQGSIPLPYINGNLWDLSMYDPDGIPSHHYSDDNMIKKSDQSLAMYGTKNLGYVCPSRGPWKELILQARNRLKDSTQTLSAGVYYDVIASAEPIRCYNSTHTHGDGNPQIWQESFHWILSQTAGVNMIEGFAENYIDVVDVFMMHDGEPNGSKVPLWNAVYGTISRSAGWAVDAANQTPASTIADMKQARSFGSYTWGSPWYAKTGNGLTYQQNLLGSSYSDALQMISASAITLEDGSSGVSKWYSSGNIQNEFDASYGKNVITKSGGNSSAFTSPEWTHSGYTNARWSIKRSNPTGMMSGFKILTGSGKSVYLYYTSSRADSQIVSNGSGPYYVYHGIGIAPNCSTCNGWQVIERDLEADLRDAMPNETITQVKQFIMFHKNGSVADIKLFPRIP